VTASIEREPLVFLLRAITVSKCDTFVSGRVSAVRVLLFSGRTRDRHQSAVPFLGELKAGSQRNDEYLAAAASGYMILLSVFPLALSSTLN